MDAAQPCEGTSQDGPSGCLIDRNAASAEFVRANKSNRWATGRRTVLVATPIAIAFGAAGCSTNNAQITSLGAGQLSTLKALCDFLIPRTDTPGAADAGCIDFVAKAIISASLDQQQGLLSTIDWLGGMIVSARSWSDLARAAAQRRSETAAALKTLRSWILLGYYTSEAGATKELRYELVPGRFDPDLPVTADTRSYSSDWVGVSMGGRL